MKRFLYLSFLKFSFIYLFVSGGESEEESDLSESEEKSSDESETEKSSEESSDSSETEEEKVSPNFPVYLPYFFQSITSFVKKPFKKNPPADLKQLYMTSRHYENLGSIQGENLSLNHYYLQV